MSIMPITITILTLFAGLHTLILGWFFVFVREESTKRSNDVSDLHKRLEESFVTKELLNSQLETIKIQITHLSSQLTDIQLLLTNLRVDQTANGKQNPPN